MKSDHPYIIWARREQGYMRPKATNFLVSQMGGDDEWANTVGKKNVGIASDASRGLILVRTRMPSRCSSSDHKILILSNKRKEKHFFKTCEVGPSEGKASGNMRGSRLSSGTNPNTVYYVNPTLMQHCFMLNRNVLTVDKIDYQTTY